MKFDFKLIEKRFKIRSKKELENKILKAEKRAAQSFEIIKEINQK